MSAGERSGRLRDPFAQRWMISSRIEDVGIDEVEARLQQNS
jgi:hypothetical protein